MTMQGNDFSAQNFNQRLLQEFYDSYDEELEMELDDLRFGSDEKMEDGEKAWRKQYFRELLRQVPYEDSELKPIDLPPRERNEDYRRSPVPDDMIVPEVY